MITALGIRLMELGSLAIHQDRLHSIALPFLRELHRVTGLVVQFGVLDASDVVYLDKIGGMLAGVVPTRVGERSSAERSALGRVLLAFGDFHVGAEAPMSLRQELSRIRDSGVAYGAGLVESRPQLRCCAGRAARARDCRHFCFRPVGDAQTRLPKCGTCPPCSVIDLGGGWPNCDTFRCSTHHA